MCFGFLPLGKTYVKPHQIDQKEREARKETLLAQRYPLLLLLLLLR